MRVIRDLEIVATNFMFYVFVLPTVSITHGSQFERSATLRACNFWIDQNPISSLVETNLPCIPSLVPVIFRPASF